jgi:ubiquinone biosynthesis monooxygenase Coq7
MTTPSPSARTYGQIDRLICRLDLGLRAVSGVSVAQRPYPAADLPETLTAAPDRKHAAALMRVNHSGEVAAQALYQGQAFVASNSAMRHSLLEAGREENDHLAWCATRIEELGGRISILNPLWYVGSFAIGALAGCAGDRTSLGFVAETERQVVEHLQDHLQQLPQDDARTRAIIEQMSTDEARHGNNAMQSGGAVLPALARTVMKLSARIMTRTAYWV